MMKILSFVDVHAKKSSLKKILEKSKKADILICAGDLSSFGDKFDGSLSILKKSGKKILIIPGNSPHETKRQVSEISRKYEDVVDIHGKIYSIGDCFFFGYGGGGFSTYEKKLESFAMKIKNKIPKEKKIVFVTHTPPYNTKLDYLPWLKEHRGCKSVLKVIRLLRPDLVICGHFHENANKSCYIGKSLVINPGWNGKINKL